MNNLSMDETNSISDEKLHDIQAFAFYGFLAREIPDEQLLPVVTYTNNQSEEKE